ncbi:nucleotidyltransferase domain-containing protein [Cohnella sp.]|uniref:nucleotidyltransferase domain-containing protein n=1 Tax=Cohnella sp. TaxID=1883426 RepID=UPI00356163BA
MQSGFPALALARLAETLQSCKARWVLGGSTGLAIRGAKLDRAPRDIDIYADRDSVYPIHNKLRQYVLDGPEDNETERYQSILSHYRLGDTIVELVGGFRVNALQSSYVTEINDVLYPSSDWIDIQGYVVPIVPLGHELIFNLLRERTDRAQIAGQLLAREPGKQLALLHTLLQRNQLAADVSDKALRLAQADSHLFHVTEEEPS